jgi:hypothetical protein
VVLGLAERRRRRAEVAAAREVQVVPLGVAPRAHDLVIVPEEGAVTSIGGVSGDGDEIGDRDGSDDLTSSSQRKAPKGGYMTRMHAASSGARNEPLLQRRACDSYFVVVQRERRSGRATTLSSLDHHLQRW